MRSIVMSGAVVVLAFGGVLFGMLLRSVLPQHHLSADLRDIAKVALGIVATISALVLSLLLSTAKADYDSRGNELIQLSADILLLDRVLSYYGPDAAKARAQLRATVVQEIQRLWPSDDAAAPEFYADTSQLETLHDRISRLIPDAEGNSALRAQGLQLMTDINRSSFLLVSHVSPSIPVPFLIVLIVWLTVIFTGLGLLAPTNPTGIIIFLTCVLSAAGAVFLILELDDPFSGIIKISDTPLQLVLTRLGQ